MRPAIYLLLTLGAIVSIAADETAGLYLRAVADETTEGAMEMPDENGQSVFVSQDAIITPDDVESVTVEGEEDVSLNFEFKPSGQTKLGKATRSMIGKKLAIIVDGKLLSTPVVQSEFSTGANISGNFTREWADSAVKRMEANRKD